MIRSKRLQVLGLVTVVLVGSHAVAQSTTRVSVGLNGEPNGESADPRISRSARVIVFSSTASNLVPGDTNGVRDVFWLDRYAGLITRISVAPSGVEADGWSGGPDITPDGRHAVFFSHASNLVAGDQDGVADVFHLDLLAGTLERISINAAGQEPDADAEFPAISDDGRYIAFHSACSNLVPGDNNARVDIFVKDRATGQIERVSVATDGSQGNGSSVAPSISADGRFVAFSSHSTNLVQSPVITTWSIFVHDRQTGITSLASVGMGHTAPDNLSLDSTFSPDGSLLAFTSLASNLVPGDTNLSADVFVLDRNGGTTSRVSLTSTGSQMNGTAGGRMSFTEDGGIIVFAGNAALDPPDSNGVEDVFVHDLVTGSTRRVSLTTAGTEGNGASYIATVSRDGRFVAFQSLATNLVSGDSNGTWDVFLRDLGAAPPYQFCYGDGIGGTSCPCGNNGAASHGCANAANAAGALLTTTGTTTPDTVALTCTGMPASVSSIFLKADATSSIPAVFGDGLRCIDGQIIRLGLRQAVSGVSAYPGPSNLPVSVRGMTPPSSGLIGYYQVYYRNAMAAFCPPATYNISNGLVIEW